jgi:hypothetical protein
MKYYVQIRKLSLIRILLLIYWLVGVIIIVYTSIDYSMKRTKINL